MAASWQNPDKKLSGMHARIVKHFGASSPELVPWVRPACQTERLRTCILLCRPVTWFLLRLALP